MKNIKRLWKNNFDTKKMYQIQIKSRYEKSN